MENKTVKERRCRYKHVVELQRCGCCPGQAVVRRSRLCEKENIMTPNSISEGHWFNKTTLKQDLSRHSNINLDQCAKIHLNYISFKKSTWHSNADALLSCTVVGGSRCTLRERTESSARPITLTQRRLLCFRNRTQWSLNMSKSTTLVFLFIVKNKSQFIMAGASAAVRISCMNKVRRDAGDTALRPQHSGMRARRDHTSDCQLACIRGKV